MKSLKGSWMNYLKKPLRRIQGRAAYHHESHILEYQGIQYTPEKKGARHLIKQHNIDAFCFLETKVNQAKLMQITGNKFGG